MTSIFLFIYRRSFLAAVILLLLASCKKDADKTEFPPGTNEYINQWILDSLQRYYYWSDQLPNNANLSQEPKIFFTSALNVADRFSYMVLPNDPSTFPGSTKNNFGFEYSTLLVNNETVLAVVKLVLDDSPASRTGLKRGDYFISINGKKITKENAPALQQELLLSEKITLGMAKYEGSVVTETGTMEVTAGVTFEQYATWKILEGSHAKTSYLHFIDFNTGLAASLYPAFENFKSEGISELILDLRYNAGGQVAEAAALCAMIASGVSYNAPFITYKGNKNGGVKNETIGTTATFDGSADFNTLLQHNLGLKKIYILGTGATASAAEIMINNLKPFMQVVFIGETTRGKDEASFKIFDAREPKQVQWEMHPIIYKLFNAQGKGDYSKGLSPDIAVNELSVLPLVPVGDQDDPLIRAALANIGGKMAGPQVNGNRSLAAQNIPVLLTDTRIEHAQHSRVITHR